MEAALTKDDAVITAYRAHGWAYIRGISLLGVLAELTGTFIDVRIMADSVYLKQLFHSKAKY